VAIVGRTATVAELNGVNTITGTLPSGTAATDVVIATFAGDSSVANFTGPGGSWTAIKSPAVDATAANLYAVYWAVNPGAGPTVSTTSAVGRWTCIVQSYTGVNTGSPIDATQQTTTGNGTSLAATGVTTAHDGALVMSMYMVDSSSRTLTQPGTMTMVKSYTVSGGGQALAVAEETKASAGATGTRTWSMSSTALDQTAVVWALKPAILGDATQTMTAGATADGRVNPARGAATQTMTAGATAAGSLGAKGNATQTMTAGATAVGDVAQPAFPLSPLPITVELVTPTADYDITDLVYGRDEAPITISRGRTAETGHAERSTCVMTLNNRDGYFSPRNPTGPLYGVLGQNTELHVTIEEGGPYLLNPGGASDIVSTPDSAALSITGDIDVRIDLYADDWARDENRDLVGKYESTGNQASWLLRVGTTSFGALPQFYWTVDGTAGTVHNWNSNRWLPTEANGRLAIRFTLDVDNGIGGQTASWYWAATIDGPWTLVSETFTTNGTTSIFDGTAALQVGNVGGSVGGDFSLPSKIYAVEVYDGIDGTLVANPVFSDQILGATSFFDDQGNTWTLAGDMELTNRSVRFVGEVSEWPQDWDTSGTDRFVSITASGVMRRLGQGQSAVSSTLARALPAVTTMVAYWPCEDGKNAKTVGSGLPGQRGMVVSGIPTFEAYDDFVCSGPLPTMGTGRFDGVVQSYTVGSGSQVRWLMAVPTTGGTDASQLIKVYCTGTCAKWDVVYNAGGALTLTAYDVNDTVLVTTGPVAFAVDGRNVRMALALAQSGADIAYSLSLLEVGNSGGNAISGTLAGRTVGAVTKVIIGKHNDIGSVAMGHITVESAVTSMFTTYQELNAYLNEQYGRRMIRLADENGEVVAVRGDAEDYTMMGYQGQKTYLDLMKEVAEADGGILFEPRHQLGLAYRSRNSMLRQGPAVTLDHSTSHQMLELKPTDDDRYTRNQVTVTRDGGAKATAELTDGTLSTQAPPDGVGMYDTAVTLSLAADQWAERMAYWRLHLGTVDEARYPSLRLNTAQSSIYSDQGLVRDLLSVDVGDRIAVTNVDRPDTPDDVSQLVQGYREVLAQFSHEITFVLAPESPYRVAIYDDDISRYDTDGSELTSDITSGATSVSVTITDGDVWDHSDGDFDIWVGGERMTVTGISGTTSPQTFTVTRSVNGIVKAQTAGTAVSLFTPYYYGI
jgi:hypothetical protein